MLHLNFPFIDHIFNFEQVRIDEIILQKDEFFAIIRSCLLTQRINACRMHAPILSTQRVKLRVDKLPVLNFVTRICVIRIGASRFEDLVEGHEQRDQDYNQKRGENEPEGGVVIRCQVLAQQGRFLGNVNVEDIIADGLGVTGYADIGARLVCSRLLNYECLLDHVQQIKPLVVVVFDNIEALLVQTGRVKWHEERVNVRRRFSAKVRLGNEHPAERVEIVIV